MCVAVVRYCAKGYLDAQLIEPSFHFVYEFAPFVRPLPALLLRGLFALLAFSALAMAFGFYYRIAAGIFLFGFSYVELIDRATYLNHYYLVSLLALLLWLLPAGKQFSLDVRAGRAQRKQQMPRAMLWTLRTQVGVVYFFAGVAKLNHDWLLEAQPLRIWLGAHRDVPWIGPLLGSVPAAYVASWAGALFDLSVVILLSQRHTRKLAFVVLAIFHVSTWLLFPIGMFPWIMIAAATVFFEPDWPSNCFKVCSRSLARSRSLAPPEVGPPSVAMLPKWLATGLALHLSLQVLVPLSRQVWFRDAAWTLEGFDYAWNVMVAEKVGHVQFVLEDVQSKHRAKLDPHKYLTASQAHAMAQSPALIRDFARYVAHEFYTSTGRKVSVYAEAFASLNGRPSARLVDPQIDLAGALPANWILPQPDLSPHRP